MPMTPPPLHLASASPRRREILAALGLAFSAAGEDVDETRLDGENAAAMVRRLASVKAAAAEAAHRDCAVLGSDTAVVLGDRVFGKPTSQEDAGEMLAALSGRTHDVLTAVALRYRGEERLALSASRVSFRRIEPTEAARYWASGEPRDKAGGYAIQGLGGVFVSELCGSYTGVIGLPVYETAELLRRVGIEVLA